MYLVLEGVRRSSEARKRNGRQGKIAPEKILLPDEKGRKKKKKKEDSELIIVKEREGGM